MKKSIFWLFFLAGFLLLGSNSLLAQSADSLDVGGGDIIELGTTEIKVKVETPQVKLYSSRIKPEFDDVHLEKSFLKEITGLGETFELKETVDSESDKRIDIDKILKKLR